MVCAAVPGVYLFMHNQSRGTGDRYQVRRLIRDLDIRITGYNVQNKKEIIDGVRIMA